MQKLDRQHAYSELYIDDAREEIAFSFDYAVKGLHLALNEYLQKFLAFEYIHLLENGNPHYLGGMSGCELAMEICGRQGEAYHDVPYQSEVEYWIGWIACLYQWLRNVPYSEIFSKFTLDRFVGSYPTFHECNETRMIEYMDNVILEGKHECH